MKSSVHVGYFNSSTVSHLNLSTKKTSYRTICNSDATETGEIVKNRMRVMNGRRK